MKAEAFWIVGMIFVGFANLEPTSLGFTFKMFFGLFLCILGLIFSLWRDRLDENKERLYFKVLLDILEELEKDGRTKKRNSKR